MSRHYLILNRTQGRVGRDSQNREAPRACQAPSLTTVYDQPHAARDATKARSKVAIGDFVSAISVKCAYRVKIPPLNGIVCVWLRQTSKANQNTALFPPEARPRSETSYLRPTGLRTHSLDLCGALIILANWISGSIILAAGEA